MSTKVTEFLLASGGSYLDEVIARVSSYPNTLINDLKDLDEKGYLKVDGPRSINELSELIESIIQKELGSDSTKDEQRRAVLRQILSDSSLGYDRTRVKLSIPGYALALS